MRSVTSTARGWNSAATGLRIVSKLVTHWIITRWECIANALLCFIDVVDLAWNTDDSMMATVGLDSIIFIWDGFTFGEFYFCNFGSPWILDGGLDNAFLSGLHGSHSLLSFSFPCSPLHSSYAIFFPSPQNASAKSTVTMDLSRESVGIQSELTWPLSQMTRP